MGKSKLLRVGVLLVAALAASGLVGATMSKYVTEGTGSDTARVAKWGVAVEVTGDGFKTSYSKDDTTSSVKLDTVISSSDDDNVVAPGTGGTFGGVKITGTPEVAVKVVTTADVELSGWNIGTNGEFYCPLVFTIGTTKINGLDYSLATAGGESSFEMEIKRAIEQATTKQLEAGSDLSTVGGSVTYSWEWPFENGSGKQEQSDELDTVLGNNAADTNPDNDPTIKITVTTTVTQID